jgi:hypothetical protein
MAATDNSCFWLADIWKSSPLKPFGQMKRILVGSIYGRSSVKFAHFILINQQRWPPQAILVSDWLISKKSSPLKLLSQMKSNLVGSIHGRFSIQIANFFPIRYQTWPPQTILVSDWLIFKILLLKLIGQMNRHLVRSIYERFSIKIAHFVPIR